MSKLILEIDIPDYMDEAFIMKHLDLDVFDNIIEGYENSFFSIEWEVK